MVVDIINSILREFILSFKIYNFSYNSCLCNRNRFISYIKFIYFYIYTVGYCSFSYKFTAYSVIYLEN